MQREKEKGLRRRTTKRNGGGDARRKQRLRGVGFSIVKQRESVIYFRSSIE